MKRSFFITLFSVAAYLVSVDSYPGTLPIAELHPTPVIDNQYEIPEGSFVYSFLCKRRSNLLESKCQPAPIRNQVVMMIHPQHAGLFSIGQVCDVWDFVNKHWSYLQDPNEAEYFDSAEHAIRTLRGDCDDQAIALATSLRSIGGLCRIVFGYNDVSGHAYPQVCLGNANLVQVEKYLRWRYHINDPAFVFTVEKDQWGNRWLNLDPLQSHPGGGLFFAKTGFVFILGHPDQCIDF